MDRAGEKIRIKEWEELIELGDLIDGDILLEQDREWFLEEMRELCGKKVSLKSDLFHIDGLGSYDGWALTPNMYDYENMVEISNIEKVLCGEVKSVRSQYCNKPPILREGMLLELPNYKWGIVIDLNGNLNVYREEGRERVSNYNEDLYVEDSLSSTILGVYELSKSIDFKEVKSKIKPNSLQYGSEFNEYIDYHSIGAKLWKRRGSIRVNKSQIQEGLGFMIDIVE